jgi:adenosine deaminase
MIRSRRGNFLLLLFLALSAGLPQAQSASPVSRGEKPHTASQEGAEARAARAFDEARRVGPPALRVFLHRMPKGADLHNHLSGAIYAESWIHAAAEDHLCINTQALAFDKGESGGCQSGEVPANAALLDQHLYDHLIDAFSLRTFVPKTADSGHDQFFETFDRFGGTSKEHMGEWLDEVATRAAAQDEQYLELMDTPDFKQAAALAVKIGFNQNFAQYRQQLLDAGLRNDIPAIRAHFDAAEADRSQREHCGTADAVAACKVEIRFIYQVLRGKAPGAVFAQLVQGFEAASADPHIVGINLVQPEDGYIAMRDYRLQMRMLDALHRFYPKVHITLHAGELAFGMVPPEGLSFHIRSAIEQGNAERIGHGVDLMYEERPYELLQEMATRHIMVEINLTSNDVILNVKGKDHPFMLYRKYGVPVALSTDDEGVSRIDLTHEYQRAAESYPLTYRDLKQMARTSLEHAFLPGASLWQPATPETLDKPVAECAGQPGREKPSGACARFIAASEKAQQQWELERRFRAFEENF